MHVLVIGYGKMGRIYGRHLSELGVGWAFYDPYVEGGLPWLTTAWGPSTHVVITTPTHLHLDTYLQVRRDFGGPVLIEKPVVTSHDRLNVLQHPQTWAGLCERWNPAWLAFCRRYNHGDVLGLRFFRMAPVANVLDLGIHDLDLWAQWHGLPDRDRPPETRWLARDGCLVVGGPRGPYNGSSGLFRWVAGDAAERFVLADLSDGRTVVVDLAGQRLAGVQVGAWSWPVKAMLRDYLNGKRWEGALTSHRLLFDAVAKQPRVGVGG